MNNENEIYNNISKSISKQSEYSEPFDNYEDVIRYSNLNNIIENKKSIKEEKSIYEDFSEEKNISIIKERNSNNINDDINEGDVISLFKRNSSGNNNIEFIKKNKPNKKIHSNNNITNNLNINEIREENIEEINTNLDENLYSDKDYSESLHNVGSEVNFINPKIKHELRITKINKPINNNKINFDFNLEPLDTVSTNTDNKQKKKKEKNAKKTFKKLLTFNNVKSDKKETGFNLTKKLSVETKSILPSEFSKSIRKKKKIYFDPNNILRKAVIMNAKKRIKNNLFDTIFNYNKLITNLLL